MPPARPARDQSRSLANLVKHRANRNHALPNLAGQAGNATQITDTDTGFPGATGVTVAFPNLNAGLDPNDPNQTTPSPSVADQFFLSRKFPQVSIIRPTETENAAKGALKGLIDDGLFIGQTSKSGKPDGLLELLTDLAKDADDATRGA